MPTLDNPRQSRIFMIPSGSLLMVEVKFDK